MINRLMVYLLILLLPLSLFSQNNSYLAKTNHNKVVITELDSLLLLVSNMSDTVHSLQQERGASSGFISSDGKKFKFKLSTISQNSNLAINELLSNLHSNKNFLNRYFSSKEYDNLNTKFDELYLLREDVEKLNIDFSTSYSKYTQIIAFLLLNISDISDKVKDKELMNKLYSYSILLMHKESIGQKRAALSALFSYKKFSKEIFEYYLTSDTQEKIYLKTFLHSVDEKIKELYFRTLDNDVLLNVKEYEKLALDKLNGEEVNVDPVKWFENVTKKINLIQSVEYKIFDDISTLVKKLNYKSLSYLTQEEKNWIKEHPVIKVGGEMDWPPFDYVNEKGKYKGIANDYLKKIEALTGLNFNIHTGLTWDELLAKAKAKELDLLPVAYYTKDRLKYFNYTEPYLSLSHYIFTDDRTEDIKSTYDLKGKRLCMIKGYATEELIKNKVPDIKIVYVKNVEEALNSLISNKADAYIDVLQVVNYAMNKNAIFGIKQVAQADFENTKLHMMSRKDYTLLPIIIQKAMDLIPEEEHYDIIAKWVGTTKETSSFQDLLSKKEREWLDKKIPIRYVYDPDWAPFEWKNELEKHTGMIYDILNIIALKSKIELVPVAVDKWSDAVEKAKIKEVDMYSGINQTAEKSTYMQFTKKSIYKAPYVFVTRLDDKSEYFDTFKDVKDKKVAVVNGYSIHDTLLKNEPNLELLAVDSTKGGFEKLRDKSIDVFVVNAATAKYYLNTAGFSDLRVAIKTKYYLDLKIAIRKDWPKEVITIIDKALDTISQKELDDIYHKWTQVRTKQETNWKLIFQILGVGFLIFAFIIYSNRKLKKLVDEKTSELQSSLNSFDKNVIASSTDIHGKITYASDALCKISGYSSEELLGNSHRLLRHPDMPKELFDDLWASITTNQVWRGEIKNKKKDGGHYWVDAIITPEHNQKNELIGYSAIRQDITAKKEVEALSSSLEQKVEARTEELKEQKEFVQIVLDSQEQLIITTDGKSLVSANESFYDFYGVSSVEEFIKSYNANCICDTFNTNAPEGYLQIKMQGKTWIDYVISSPIDSSHKAMISMGNVDFIFSVTAAKLSGSNGLKSAVFTNITEMERAKEEVEQILENILLPVLITSKKERKILYANKYAEIQYEKSIDEIIGSNIDSVYTVQGQHYHIVDAINKYGRIENMEEIFKTSTGKDFTALLSVTPINYKGKESYIGMVVDITKQKEMENEVRAIHKHTKESIEYAALIQSALVPDNNVMRKYFQDQFIIWHPKSTVGGDIYLFEELRNQEECLLMVIDCTGHGVPGALVTMLVKAIERQVTTKINGGNDIVNTAEILSTFNKDMKQLLQQEDSSSISNAGFDGQIIYYNKKEKIIKCASARNEIFYYQDDKLNVIKGDRHSIGYKDSDSNYEFTEHIIDVSKETTMYISSDGYWDQNGGEKGFPFGKKRFKTMLDEIYKENMSDQQEMFLYTSESYKADYEVNDDVTVIGLKI